MGRIDWRRLSCILIVLVTGGALFYAALRYLLPLFLPFLLAFLTAALTRPLVRFLRGRTGWPQGVCAVLAVLFFLTVTGLLLYLLCLRLFSELQRLLGFLAQDSARADGNIASALRLLREWGGRLPLLARLQEADFFRDLLGDPSQYFAKQVQNLLGELAGKLTGTVGELLSRLPGVLLFLLVTLIACFYFALEYERVCEVTTRLFPPFMRSRLPEWRARAGRAFKRCAKAYLLLFLITFSELFFGFVILRVSYSFLLALLAASLDVLPVLGVGTVLIPWAVFAFLTGNTARGIGLLILYGVITVVRQIAEPRLVGKSIGLHPILMLMAFYVGFSLFGVAGIVIGPALALLCKLLFEYSAPEMGT